LMSHPVWHAALCSGVRSIWDQISADASLASNSEVQMIGRTLIPMPRSRSVAPPSVIRSSAEAVRNSPCRGRRNKGALALLAAVTAACGLMSAGFAAAEESSPATPIECHIKTTQDSGFLRLQAIGSSNAPVSGHYVFSISKRNAAGSSENTESGDFTLAPGQDRVLATVMLEAAASGHFSADLSLSWSGGRISCRAP
jgi:hypothetical protein